MKPGFANFSSFHSLHLTRNWFLNPVTDHPITWTFLSRKKSWQTIQDAKGQFSNEKHLNAIIFKNKKVPSNGRSSSYGGGQFQTWKGSPLFSFRKDKTQLDLLCHFRTFISSRGEKGGRRKLKKNISTSCRWWGTLKKGFWQLTRVRKRQNENAWKIWRGFEFFWVAKKCWQ